MKIVKFEDGTYGIRRGYKKINCGTSYPLVAKAITNYTFYCPTSRSFTVKTKLTVLNTLSEARSVMDELEREHEIFSDMGTPV